MFRSSLSLPGVKVSTVGKIQGDERPIVILDITAAGALGLIREKARINTALSRARHGLIIVASRSQLESSKGAYKYSLVKIFKRLGKDAAITEFSESARDRLREHWKELVPDLSQRPKLVLKPEKNLIVKGDVNDSIPSHTHKGNDKVI